MNAGATLPSPTFLASAAWGGNHAYVFGGDDPQAEESNQIIRFDPVANTATLMSATLPSVRRDTSAVWDGSNFYIIGGEAWDGGKYATSNQIVRYSPTTGAVTTMSAVLPSGRAGTSAIWDGSHIYVFGGRAGLDSNQILRYNPATNVLTTMTATLPTGRSLTSAIWDGSNAYIFGGFAGTSAYVDEIVRYHPGTNTVTTMTARPPSVRGYTSAIWDGSNAYIFGGFSSSTQQIDQIVRYHPASDAATVMGAPLPTARDRTSAIWDGSHAYVLGGIGSQLDGILNPEALDEILRYELTPGAPRGVAASGQTTSTQVLVRWDPPAANSHSAAITNYRIYRGPVAGLETFLVEVGNVLSYTDTVACTPGTYFYHVTAVDSNGESPRSQEAIAARIPISCP